MFSSIRCKSISGNDAFENTFCIFFFLQELVKSPIQKPAGPRLVVAHRLSCTSQAPRDHTSRTNGTTDVPAVGSGCAVQHLPGSTVRQRMSEKAWLLLFCLKKDSSALLRGKSRGDFSLTARWLRRVALSSCEAQRHSKAGPVIDSVAEKATLLDESIEKVNFGDISHL